MPLSKMNESAISKFLLMLKLFQKEESGQGPNLWKIPDFGDSMKEFTFQEIFNFFAEIACGSLAVPLGAVKNFLDGILSLSDIAISEFISRQAVPKQWKLELPKGMVMTAFYEAMMASAPDRKICFPGTQLRPKAAFAVLDWSPWLIASLLVGKIWWQCRSQQLCSIGLLDQPRSQSPLAKLSVKGLFTVAVSQKLSHAISTVCRISILCWRRATGRKVWNRRNLTEWRCWRKRGDLEACHGWNSRLFQNFDREAWAHQPVTQQHWIKAHCRYDESCERRPSWWPTWRTTWKVLRVSLRSRCRLSLHGHQQDGGIGSAATPIEGQCDACFCAPGHLGYHDPGVQGQACFADWGHGFQNDLGWFGRPLAKHIFLGAGGISHFFSGKGSCRIRGKATQIDSGVSISL